MKTWVIFLFFLFLLFGYSTKAQNNSDPAFYFRVISKIQLKTLKGESAFIKQNNAALSLFVFLSPECPLCKNYSPILNKLSDQFAGRLKVYGLVPGLAYTGSDLQHFAKEYQIVFPLLIDSKKEFSDYIKATITPEVVLVDKSGAVIYRGAIDDWVRELGKKKLKPEEHYLENAINQYLNGSPVLVKKTIPKGCFINEF